MKAYGYSNSSNNSSNKQQREDIYTMQSQLKYEISQTGIDYNQCKRDSLTEEEISLLVRISRLNDIYREVSDIGKMARFIRGVLIAAGIIIALETIFAIIAAIV